MSGCAGSLLLHELFRTCGEWVLLSSRGTWAFITVASLVAEHGVRLQGLQ